MTLRAVGKDEKPQVKKPKTVAQAAKSGSQRELLVAMRNQIGETISTGCQPRDLAALTKRLQDIAHDIDVIDARDDEDLAERVRILEAALLSVAPDHPLMSGVEMDDEYDASAI
jgi:spore maturation protein CgeB